MIMPSTRHTPDDPVLCFICFREGKRSFAPVMHKRLKKLGIAKTNPAELTEDEVHRSANHFVSLADVPGKHYSCIVYSLLAVRDLYWAC
jgi:hypothetical protein